MTFSNLLIKVTDKASNFNFFVYNVIQATDYINYNWVMTEEEINNLSEEDRYMTAVYGRDSYITLINPLRDKYEAVVNYLGIVRRAGDTNIPF